jgi:ubiquinone/menaquinone biosynthesis C-methylase UbiE
MIRNLARTGARGLLRISRTLERLGGTQATAIQEAMANYDMAARPDENYYLRQYWHWLLPELEKRFPMHQAKALDVGCGQGRLTLPLAEWLTSGVVVGVDLTSEAIEKARAYALQRGLGNVELHEADALDYLRSLPAESIDLALMLEVSFFMPAYRDVIAEISRVLKRNGVFFVSFRSQYFDLLHSVGKRDWQSARLVLDEREGHLGSGVAWYSWHTTEDIREILAAEGFTLNRICGIGVCSGIEGDPLSLIAQPSTLSDRDRAELMEVELSLAQQYADCGRYVLAVASKRES